MQCFIKFNFIDCIHGFSELLRQMVTFSRFSDYRKFDFQYGGSEIEKFLLQILGFFSKFSHHILPFLMQMLGYKAIFLENLLQIYTSTFCDNFNNTVINCNILLSAMLKIELPVIGES